jgi:hypothetical protein
MFKNTDSGLTQYLSTMEDLSCNPRFSWIPVKKQFHRLRKTWFLKKCTRAFARNEKIPNIDMLLDLLKEMDTKEETLKSLKQDLFYSHLT